MLDRTSDYQPRGNGSYHGRSSDEQTQSIAICISESWYPVMKKRARKKRERDKNRINIAFSYLCSKTLLSNQLVYIIGKVSAKLSSSNSLLSFLYSGLSAPTSLLSGISTASPPARNVTEGFFLDDEFARARMSWGFTFGVSGYALSKPSGILFIFLTIPSVTSVAFKLFLDEASQ